MGQLVFVKWLVKDVWNIGFQDQLSAGIFQYWDISRIIPSISPSIIIPCVVLYDSIYYSTFHIFFNLNSTFFDLLNMYNIPSTIPCVIPFIISLFYSTYKSIYYDVNCSIYSISFTPFCDNENQGMRCAHPSATRWRNWLVYTRRAVWVL